MAIALAGLGPLVALVPVGFGLTYIQDKYSYKQILHGNLKKITRVVETNKIARIFAGIFTFGLTELMNHRKVSVEYSYEDKFICCDTDSPNKLYNEGKEFYIKGNYEKAAIYFAIVCDLTEASGNIIMGCRENLERVRQKIKEEAERRECEEAARREQEQAEKIKRKKEEAMRREREREENAKRKQEAERRAREEDVKRKQEAERRAREEALQLEIARTQSKSLLEEAINIYQQAEALTSLELKLDKYEIALSKCKESCASDATETALNTLNKIFDSCLKHDAHDEAEIAIDIVREYFPSKASHLQDILFNQQSKSGCPDYESRARRQQEQQEKNRTVLMALA